MVDSAEDLDQERTSVGRVSVMSIEPTTSACSSGTGGPRGHDTCYGSPMAYPINLNGQEPHSVESSHASESETSYLVPLSLEQSRCFHICLLSERVIGELLCADHVENP